MTQEDLDAIAKRLGADRKLNTDKALLFAEVRRLQAERDAAVADLREIFISIDNLNLPCKYCRNRHSEYECNSCDPTSHHNEWEWRGV